MSAAPRSKPLLTLLLPEVWAESMQSLLEPWAEGLILMQVDYPSGALEGERSAPRQVTLSCLAKAEGVEQLPVMIQQWLADWAVPAAAWSLEIAMVDEAELHRRGHWQQHWRPFRCAGFVLHPSFTAWKRLPTRPDDRRLTLVPGSAFGTGGHATTRLALQALAAHVELGLPLRRVLDVGTGSGILAVAAARCGAELVVGMDPDPQSPGQARRMADLNGVGEACTFWRGTSASANGRFDLVFANLVADLLIAAAPDLAQRLAPGGRLFTGGVMRSRRPAVVAALESTGLALVGGPDPWRQRGRWCADGWQLA